MNIVIIGGGIVGCAIAYQLSQNKNFTVTVIDRNDSIPSINQSSRNGGVIHSGVYYPKDIEPLKAKLSVEGNRLMYEFCKQYNLPHKNMGKLIVATNEREEAYIQFFLKTGLENGVPGVKIVTAEEVKALEPNLEHVKLALHVPSVGSAALVPVLSKLKELGEQQGVSFLLGTTVTNITPTENSVTITTTSATGKQELQTDLVINAAGLYADDVAKMINPDLNYVIEPTRSELDEFDTSTRPELSLSGMHIYQVPYCYDTQTRERVYPSAEAWPKLLHEGKIAKAAGIHLSPAFDCVDGKYVLRTTFSIGPVKTLGLGKEDYTSQLKPVKTYIDEVKAFFPHLQEQDLRPRYTGIMAILRGHDDFIIEQDKKHPNCIQLVGMDSPAWTSSLAIGKYVKGLIER